MGGMIARTLTTTLTPVFGKITTMAKILEEQVGDREVHVGARGGRYVLTDKGRRLYIVEEYQKTRTFKPRRGAYKRFLEAQQDCLH